ncbi:MAG TPA: hypothetical protein VF575_00835 [Candidatus Saccharimonadales bacterium]|jgi:hypothetical protein
MNTAKPQKPYVTLAKPGDASEHSYHDRDSLPFNVIYPLVEFQPSYLNIGADAKVLQKELLYNYWYQKGNVYERDGMLKRVVHINEHLQIVLDFIDKTYGPLGFTIEHISIAGSYAHAEKPGDIDFDVVLSGSFFDYITFNEGIDILDQTDNVRKISLTVMGIENVLGNAFVPDDIRNKGFVHHDTIIREMLIAPMRNITVYGRPFDHTKNIDSRNVMVRIARQLYFAELTLEGKIPYYSEDPLRTKKAVNRIREAYQIIEWLLQGSKDFK